MLEYFDKKFTNDNKISVCYVVDRLRQILKYEKNIKKRKTLN
jgi:hypothetical protein